jgi:hypothetical protein
VDNYTQNDLETSRLSASLGTLDTGGRRPGLAAKFTGDEWRHLIIGADLASGPRIPAYGPDTAAKSLLEQVVDKHPTWGQLRLE